MENKEDAKALHQSAQQQRTHWSNIISALNGLAITILVGIWSYYLPSIIYSFYKPWEAWLLYVIVPFSVSSMVIGAWRIYVTYLDNYISSLYVDLLNYELMVETQLPLGTVKYLGKETSYSYRKGKSRKETNIFERFQDEKLNHKQKLSAINLLHQNRRIGWRGHKYIDSVLLSFNAVAFLIVLVLSLLVLLRFDWVTLLLVLPECDWSLLPASQCKALPISVLIVFLDILVIAGLAIMGYSFCRHQKNTRKKDVDKAVAEVRKEQS